ncbi:MAG: hypothetical protein COA97_05760 [Flavobacteriales bacterium]|nr:MAG: hypothetical protein COA97_05760 [Flavobacteriales bacterium]
MKEIENLISSIKKWCDTNSIKHFEGTLTEYDSVFELNLKDSVFEFLEICKSNNIAHIIFETELYSFEEYEYEILDDSGIVDDEPINQIQDVLSESTKFDNSIDYLIIYCVHEGIIYKSSFIPEWRTKIENEIDLVIKKYVQLKREEIQRTFPNCYEQRDRICNKIASHPNFLRFSTRSKKKKVIIENVLIEEDIEITERNLKIVKFISTPNVLDIFYNKYFDDAASKINMQIRAMKKKDTIKLIPSKNLT